MRPWHQGDVIHQVFSVTTVIKKEVPGSSSPKEVSSVGGAEGPQGSGKEGEPEDKPGADR